MRLDSNTIEKYDNKEVSSQAIESLKASPSRRRYPHDELVAFPKVSRQRLTLDTNNGGEKGIGYIGLVSNWRKTVAKNVRVRCGV